MSASRPEWRTEMGRSWMFALTGLLTLVAACRREQPAAISAAPEAVAGMRGMTADTPRAEQRPLVVTAAERRRLGIMMTTATLSDMTRDVRLVGRVVPAETSQR